MIVNLLIILISMNYISKYFNLISVFLNLSFKKLICLCLKFLLVFIAVKAV